MTNVLRLYATQSDEFDEEQPSDAALLTDLTWKCSDETRLFLMLLGADRKTERAFLLINPFGRAIRMAQVLKQAVERLEKDLPALLRTCTFNIASHFVFEPVNQTLLFSSLTNFPGIMNNYCPVEKGSLFYDPDNVNQHAALYDYLAKNRKSLIPTLETSQRDIVHLQKIRLDRAEQMDIWRKELQLLPEN